MRGITELINSAPKIHMNESIREKDLEYYKEHPSSAFSRPPYAYTSLCPDPKYRCDAKKKK